MFGTLLLFLRHHQLGDYISDLLLLFVRLFSVL